MALLILVAGIASFVVAVVFLWKSREHSSRIGLIKRAIPTKLNEISNAFPGQVVAISGNAESEQALISEQSETPCIYYSYTIDRSYKISAIRERRSGGGQETRSRQSRETVAKDEQWVPFQVNDGSGQVSVNPDGAWFDGSQVMDRHEPATQDTRKGLPGQKMNLGNGQGLTLGYYITEDVIRSGQPVFVVGTVNEQGQIGKNEQTGMLVSHRQGSDLMDEMSNHSRTRLLGCFGFFLLGILALVGGTVVTAM